VEPRTVAYNLVMIYRLYQELTRNPSLEVAPTTLAQ